MTATLQQLFAHVQTRTAQGAPGQPPSPVDASGALEHAGRALIRLAAAGLDPEPNGPRDTTTTQLGRACRAAGTLNWRSTGGELTDRMGVAADLADTQADQLGRSQRWALAVEFAAAADQCAALTQGGLSRTAADLSEVRRLSGWIERAALTDPPTAQARVVLDRLIPNSTLQPPSRAGVQLAAEASAVLAASIGGADTRGGLTLRELKAVAMDAETVSGYAAAAVTALTDNDRDQPWQATPAAWRVVRASARIFDDGRWARPGDTSDIIAAADLIHMTLRDHLGPASNLDTAAFNARADLPAIVTGLQQQANQTPVIAAQLDTVGRRWAGEGTLHARAADLPPMEDMPERRIHKVLTGQWVRATGADLTDLRTAILRADALSTGLADALNRASTRPPIQPNLAAIYAAISDAPGAAAGRLRAAQETERALTAIRIPLHTASPAYRPGGPSPGR